MPRISRSGNVHKRCDCARWKECAHPWYVRRKEKPRGRFCRNLDQLIGRHCADLSEAQSEARRAIVAWQTGRDAQDLLPDDRPTISGLLAAYRKRTDAGAAESEQAKPIERVVINGRPFGEHAAADVTRAMLDQFKQKRPRIAGNRDLALLRAAFNWAVADGLLDATPFKVGGVSVVKLNREEPRSRRLHPGEADKLLAACEPGKAKDGRRWDGNLWLRDLIIGALETGCRRGELLSLQWSQVGRDLFLPAGKTKAKKPRRVPISSLLRAVLDARRLDPAGEPLPGDAYVFGDEVGRRRGAPKKAWTLACQRASIKDLHFHDLRREAGSRWMDAGVPLSVIQKWLGHHNISQTSTYLAATSGGDADAMLKYEQAIGRVAYGVLFPVSNGDQPTRTDSATFENAPENAVVH